MAKAVKYSAMAKEIKKEYLTQHLDDVKALIASWISQLSAPNPLAPREGIWGWLSVYRPALEEDSDSNHMLRQHVRSRALWRHHAEWEGRLSVAWNLVGLAREEAADVYSQWSDKQPTGYMENYVGVALWAASGSIYAGTPLKIEYSTPDDQLGVACGDYKIELKATTDEERKSIQSGHAKYATSIAGLTEMQELCDLWRDVGGPQKQMQAIANKILKSNDILYPCRFCRHLWK